MLNESMHYKYSILCIHVVFKNGLPELRKTYCDLYFPFKLVYRDVYSRFKDLYPSIYSGNIISFDCREEVYFD